MEDTRAVRDAMESSGGGEPSAPRDLRDWLARAEAIGQITRIREPIDWNEEMGAITYMAHQAIGAPAPLFENINPVEDIDILRQTWSTWLDPTQNPPEERPYGSKALINACMEHRYIKQFSRRTKLRRSVYESLAARWSELGFTGAPPRLWALED